MQLNRPFETRFRYGSVPFRDLTLPHRVTRRLIMQKARGQTGSAKGEPLRQPIVLPLLVSIRFQVLFHSPHWGSFHLSLTVLVHYRLPGSI